MQTPGRGDSCLCSCGDALCDKFKKGTLAVMGKLCHNWPVNLTVCLVAVVLGL